MRRGDVRELFESAQHASVGEEKVRYRQNSRKVKTEKRGNTHFIEQQDTPRLSALRHAQISCCREWFHAAAGTRVGGARSWIWAAVSLSMTFIGPPHWGQNRRFCPFLAVDGSGWDGGAEPSR